MKNALVQLGMMTLGYVKRFHRGRTEIEAIADHVSNLASSFNFDLAFWTQSDNEMDFIREPLTMSVALG